MEELGDAEGLLGEWGAEGDSAGRGNRFLGSHTTDFFPVYTNHHYVLELSV